MVTYNRRRHRRVTAKGLVVQLESGETLRPCIVENLSTGGVFIRTSELSPVGAMIHLTVTRPGMRKPIRITARVASSLDQADLVGMGVEFQSVDPEDVSKLATLLVEQGAVEAKTAPGLPQITPAGPPVRAAVTSPNAASPRGAPPASPREGANTSLAEKRIKALQEDLAKARAAVEEKDKQLSRFRLELDRVRLELKAKEEQLMRLGAKKH